MKTLIYTLALIMTSFFVAPEINAAAANNSIEASILGGGPHVNKSSAKRFKTYKGGKRAKHTCLRKGGCKPKLRNKSKTKCGGFM
jgi:hypothetical protein